MSLQTRKGRACFEPLKSLFMPNPQIPKIDVKSICSSYGGDMPCYTLLVFRTGKPGWVTQAQARPLPSHMAGAVSLPLKCSVEAPCPWLTRVPVSTLWVGTGHSLSGVVVEILLDKEREREGLHHSFILLFIHSINIYCLSGTCWRLISLGS